MLLVKQVITGLPLVNASLLALTGSFPFRARRVVPIDAFVPSHDVDHTMLFGLVELECVPTSTHAPHLLCLPADNLSFCSQYGMLVYSPDVVFVLLEVYSHQRLDVRSILDAHRLEVVGIHSTLPNRPFHRFVELMFLERLLELRMGPILEWECLIIVDDLSVSFDDLGRPYRYRLEILHHY